MWLLKWIFMRIFLFFWIFHFVVTEIAYDKAISPKHKSSHGSVSLGQQIPDWSEVALRGKPKIVEMLLAVDGLVARYYGNNRDKIRDGVLSLLHAVNQYLHQLQIQLLIVDLRVANGYNLTLEDFKNWREEEEDLPQHDLAMLLRLRYDGGIASVDGVCTREGVGISGFFPEAPHEYGSVFVHEIAHLLGLTHDTRVNCRCSRGKKGCLKIEGFEDCSAQALVEMSEKKSCLQETSNDHSLSIPICGNGIVELGEQCDCGPTKLCRNLLCDSQSCQYRLSKEILYVIAFFLFAIIGAIGYCFLRSLCSRLMNITKKSKRKALPNFQPFVVSSISSQADLKSSTSTNLSTRMLIKTGSEDSASSTAKLLPDFSRNRSNRDSKTRSRRTENLIHLDSEIPIVDPVNHSDYVKMHPAKFSLGLNEQREYLSPNSTTLPKIRSASLQRGETAQANRSPIIPLRVAPPPPNQSRRVSRSFSHLPGLPASLSASYGEATAAVLRDLRSPCIYDIPTSFISQQSFDEPPAIPPKRSLARLAV